MNKVTVISFFTNNGKYPALAERLDDSCERFQMPRVIVEADDSGEWLTNNNRKPAFIIDQLLSVRGPVLWMDIDTEFVGNPTPALNLLGCGDFGIYNWHADRQNVNGFPYDPTRLLGSGGVIYFDYTASAIELLLRWSAALNASAEGVDDQILDKVFNAPDRPPVRPIWLDKRMNWMTGLYGEPPAEGGCIVRHDFVNRKHYEQRTEAA